MGHNSAILSQLRIAGVSYVMNYSQSVFLTFGLLIGMGIAEFHIYPKSEAHPSIGMLSGTK